jgi:uncharacterized membrane protein YoaK (UPF0700 family)
MRPTREQKTCSTLRDGVGQCYTDRGRVHDRADRRGPVHVGTHGTKVSERGTQALYLFGSGAAVGLQAGAVRALNVTGVSTAYITGTLATIAADLVGDARGHRRDTLKANALLTSIWLFYVAGAAGGALLSHSASAFEIAAPAGVVVSCFFIAAAVFGIRRVR